MQITEQTHMLIADDHPLFRAAMRAALTDVVSGELFEAEDFSAAQQCLRENPDIELVFLDLSMPGNHGLTGLTQIRNEFPNTLVVIVSAEEELAVIKKAVALGSSGYIPKSTSLDDMVTAVKTILNGDNWLPAHISLDAETQTAEESDFLERLGQLTPHQFNVLKMLADGRLNKQIAYDLGISESTVKQHVSAVLKKLGVINRTQAGVLFKQTLQL
ncbi:response regulator transcription factor [Alteromonas sp. ASW11-36]|uniref:Response regulator transcription factor n=1 Tax=Alteromonas arenosi TaxID=3055817 RepID=A0ABT7SUI1_9ALTE|nr:response regulator transcription factor [Alteromonas sp. ASW11-36]MDM7859848.1 response regulator transcription factor [Alteromonas sp. ASW11-36]